jgi:hypothetical protein
MNDLPQHSGTLTSPGQVFGPDQIDTPLGRVAIAFAHDASADTTIPHPILGIGYVALLLQLLTTGLGPTRSISH